MKGVSNIGELIGVITQIQDDTTLNFMANNVTNCSIGNIVGVYTKQDTVVLAIINEIKLDFYLEDSNTFFISKAVTNDLQKLNDSKHKPRYGHNISATILGYYKFSSDNALIECDNSINRYTPNIFQEVFLIPFKETLDIYGLPPLSKANNIYKSQKNINLGSLSVPFIESDKENLPLQFDVDTFKKHTLISGITGSGKSRLAALISKKLASNGAHVSIIDPHDEYPTFLSTSKEYDVYSFRQNINMKDRDLGEIKIRPISFNENLINANSLCRILPGLTETQENKIYEIFNEFDSKSFNIKSFINRLIGELNVELAANYPTYLELVSKIDAESKRIAKNETDFIERYIHGIKSFTSKGRPDKVHVLTAIISKINELRENEIITKYESNWLIQSPSTIDLINIDFSTHDYVRRFLNSILHFFLRTRNTDDLRILIIDEAHMLLREESITSQLVRQLLREARKFNLSLLFISQNLDDIPDEIRSQFQNYFTFREPKVSNTKYFKDRICYVSLFGSKASFAMKINDCPSVTV